MSGAIDVKGMESVPERLWRRHARLVHRRGDELLDINRASAVSIELPKKAVDPLHTERRVCLQGLNDFIKFQDRISITVQRPESTLDRLHLLTIPWKLLSNYPEDDFLELVLAEVLPHIVEQL